MSASEARKSGRRKKAPEKLDDYEVGNDEEVPVENSQESCSAEHEQYEADDKGDESEDSEAEELDRLIMLEKEKIIAIKEKITEAKADCT
jgi:hypothetical protein